MEANTSTPYQQLLAQLHAYRQERGWLNLDPADVVKSIILESAELLEHYQWDNTYRSKNKTIIQKDTTKISSEVADIFIYLLEFCEDNDIDLLQKAKEKIEHNCKKYPATRTKAGGQQTYDDIKQAHRKDDH